MEEKNVSKLFRKFFKKQNNECYCIHSSCVNKCGQIDLNQTDVEAYSDNKRMCLLHPSNISVRKALLNTKGETRAVFERYIMYYGINKEVLDISHNMVDSSVAKNFTGTAKEDLEIIRDSLKRVFKNIPRKNDEAVLERLDQIRQTAS